MVSDLISELYPDALDCDIAAAEFWNMSIAEINDAMQSFKRRKDRDLKQELINGFAFAEHTAEMIGIYLHKDNKARQIWDFFPELFAEEKRLYEENEKKRQIEAARENRKAYAAEHNRRRHEMGL